MRPSRVHLLLFPSAERSCRETLFSLSSSPDSSLTISLGASRGGAIPILRPAPVPILQARGSCRLNGCLLLHRTARGGRSASYLYFSLPPGAVYIRLGCSSTRSPSWFKFHVSLPPRVAIPCLPLFQASTRCPSGLGCHVRYRPITGNAPIETELRLFRIFSGGPVYWWFLRCRQFRLRPGLRDFSSGSSVRLRFSAVCSCFPCLFSVSLQRVF